MRPPTVFIGLPGRTLQVHYKGITRALQGHYKGVNGPLLKLHLKQVVYIFGIAIRRWPGRPPPNPPSPPHPRGGFLRASWRRPKSRSRKCTPFVLAIFYRFKKNNVHKAQFVVWGWVASLALNSLKQDTGGRATCKSPRRDPVYKNDEVGRRPQR